MDSKGVALPLQASQACPYCSTGVLVKQRGPAALRWLCDTCTRTAVDASPVAPVSARDVMQWPLAHLLPWCTIRRASGVGTAPEDTASVFVGDVCAWVVPWPLARWLRDQAIIGLSSSLGAVSETVCSAAVFTWCEESIDAPGVSELGCSVDDIDVCLPRPWVWSYAPGDALSARVVASNGRQVPLLGDRPHPAPGTTPIAITCTRSADPAVQRDPDVDVEAARLLACDDAVAAASIDAVVSHLYAPGFQAWLHRPSRRQRREARQPVASLVTAAVATSELLQWCADGPTVRDAIHAREQWPVGGPGPWPSSWYPPVPLWDRTAVCASQEPAATSWLNLVSISLPLLQCPVRAGVTSLNAEAWWTALQGHPHQAFMWLGIVYGFPILVSPQRPAVGVQFIQRALPASEASQVTEFVRKERAASHMLDVVADGLVVQPADSVWVSPIVTAPKPGGAVGEVRVCHHASWGPRGSAVVPLNDDITFEALDPAGMFQLPTFVQRLRDLVAANPTRRLAGAKADAKSFFRQFPIRQRDWGFMGHRWLGVLIIHIVLSFGLRSAVHVSCALSNAISDVLQSVAGVWCAFFVDDAILLNYESAIGRDFQWLLAIGSALGLVWNAAKCVKPHWELEVLGVMFNLRTKRAWLAPAKQATLLAAVDRLLQAAADHRPVKVGHVRQLAGLAQYLGAVVPWGRAHTAPLWRLCGVDGVDDGALRVLNQECVFALRWWRSVATGGTVLCAGLDVGISPPRPLLPAYFLRSDASSRLGFGTAVFLQPGWWCRGLWTDREQLYSINVLELAAVVIGVAANASLFSGGVLVVESDNLTAVWSIWSESSRQAPLRFLTLLLCHLQAHFKFVVRVRHVPGKFLDLVDAISRSKPFQHLLPSGPGWDWRERPIPTTVRNLGVTEHSGLLWRTSPGHTHVLQQPCDTWIPTWIAGVVAASNGAFPSCAALELPFVPYLPTGAPISITSCCTV